MVNPGPFGVIYELLGPRYRASTKVVGYKNIPRTGAAVVAVDPHPSSHDPQQVVVTFLQGGRVVYFVTTYKVLRVAKRIQKVMSGAVKLCQRHLCMLLQEGIGSRDRILSTVQEKLKHGCLVGFFISGKLAHKKPRVRTGAVEAALRARVPIIPVLLKSNFRTTNFLKFLWDLVCPWKRATIFVGRPIQYPIYEEREITRKLLRDLTEKLMDRIYTLSNPH